MAFRDLLLPIGVDLEWLSAPGFSTTVVRTDNGREKRTINWDASIARGVLHYNHRQRAVWEAIDEMFQACMGRGYSFKVRDPRKNVATASEGKFNADGQAVLRITRGAYTVDKPITKLDSSITLTGGGAVDYSTGLITSGSPSAWAGKFYLCCRFDVDELELTGDDKEANGDYLAGYKDVPIVETPFE